METPDSDPVMGCGSPYTRAPNCLWALTVDYCQLSSVEHTQGEWQVGAYQGLAL